MEAEPHESAYNRCVDFADLPLTFQAAVEARHLDHLDHMNVMWYTHFFDLATWAWYETFDFGKSYHHESGFGSFALEAHTRYLAELRAGDQLHIYTRMLARNAKLFHYVHFMQRAADGELAATCELLGVHAIGPLASEILAEPVAALQLEATLDDMMFTVHAHPTLWEAMGEAFASVRGLAINV